MEVKLNNSEQNINLTLTQGSENPINIQLKPSEQQPLSVTLKPNSSPLGFAIVQPIVKPIHFLLSPNVIKEIISGSSHLYDLYDVQADGNSVFGACGDAILTYNTEGIYAGRWTAELPAELTITRNGEVLGVYKVRGAGQTIDIPVPTLVSQLENDALYATQAELDEAISAIRSFRYEVVDNLPIPAEDTMGIIYLVRRSSNDANNYYEEYITLRRGGSYVWEKIGGTRVNLDGYATLDDLEESNENNKQYTDDKNAEIRDYVEGVRENIITSVEDTIQQNTELVQETQEHLAQVESDLQETGERLDAEAERLLNIKAELDGELTRVGVEIDETNASIESVAIRVDENSGTIGEVKETLDATNLTLSETVTKLEEDSGKIVQLRNEMDGIDETIVSIIDSQLSDEDSQITQSIGLVVDNKTQSIELAVKAIREGTDESTVAWVGQKIDAADEEIKTSIETMIYGEGYTETQTIGQIIDGKKDEISTYVLQSEELVGEDGLISQSIDGAYTEWGIDSIKNSVSSIEGVLSEDGELINVSTRFSTIEQNLDSIQLIVGESTEYGDETILDKFSAITLELSRIGLVVSEGSNYAAIVAQINAASGDSEVLIEADKIHLLGETVVEQLTAQSATIGNLTLTNATVSGTINANAGNIGGWQIGPESESGTYLYGGNLILSSQGFIKNESNGKVHYTLNNDGSGSLADGNIWWDNEGALYFSGDAVVVTDSSDITQGQALAQLVSDISKVLSMFDIDSENNAVYVKGDRNFYAYGEITALGQGTGGGGGGEGGADLHDVWISISGNTDAYKDYQVNPSHLTAYLTRAQIQETYATKEDLENIDIPALSESDPIFKASAAYGINSSDISNWNSIRSAIPTSLSNLSNDVGYITASAIPSTYAWSAITGKPTTLAGYGITDAYTASTIDNKLSGYLPLSGGTITSNANTILTLKGGASNDYSVAYFMNGDTYRGYVGWNSTYGIGLYNYTQTAYLGIKDDGTPYYNEYTLIHSGNIGSQSVNYATNATYASSINTTQTSWNDYFNVPLLDSNAGGQRVLYVDSSGGLRFNPSTNTLNVSGNVLIGTTTDNGAKLQVSGNLHLETSDGGIVIQDTNSNTYATTDGYIKFNNKYATVAEIKLKSNELSLNAGAVAIYINDAEKMRVNSAGNVGIGTTIDSGAKLQVVDTSKKGAIASQIRTSAIVEIGAVESGNDSLYIGQLDNSAIWMQSAYGGTSSIPSSTYTYSLLLQPLGGNVGIGTTSPSFKLDVYNNATTDYDFHIYNNATQTSLYVGKSGLWYGTGLDEDVAIFSIHSACQYDGGGGRTEFSVDCSGNATARSAFRLSGAGQAYSGLFVNSRITSGGYATDLWLYNDQRLILYGTEIVMQTNTSVAGNITASGEVTALGSSSSSDRRLKDIVSRPTPLLLEDIAKLNVISFTWNHRDNDKRLKLGLIAQEVKEVMPELVGVDRSNYYTLDYSTFGSVVGVMNTKKILSLEEEVIALRNEVKELRRKIYG